MNEKREAFENKGHPLWLACVPIAWYFSISEDRVDIIYMNDVLNKKW